LCLWRRARTLPPGLLARRSRQGMLCRAMTGEEKEGTKGGCEDPDVCGMRADEDWQEAREGARTTARMKTERDRETPASMSSDSVKRQQNDARGVWEDWITRKPRRNQRA